MAGTATNERHDERRRMDDVEPQRRGRRREHRLLEGQPRCTWPQAERQHARGLRPAGEAGAIFRVDEQRVPALAIAVQQRARDAEQRHVDARGFREQRREVEAHPHQAVLAREPTRRRSPAAS